MNPKDMLWVEKYRPQTIEDLIAPARYKKLLLNIVKSGKFPNMLFTGSAGTGKTTASKALCNQMDLEYKLINASKNRGIDYLRTVISEYASNGSWEGKFRVLILDEADKLTIDTQDALRHLIEDNFNTCRFILTGNYPYKFIDALKSRLDHQSFVFDTIDIKEISKPVWVRINEILVAENVTMENPTSVAQFIKDSLPDIRHIIKRMQSLSIQGEGVIPADISRNEMSLTVETYKAVLKSNYTELAKFVYRTPAEVILQFVEDNVVSLAKSEEVIGPIMLMKAHYEVALNQVRSQTGQMIAFVMQSKQFII